MEEKNIFDGDEELKKMGGFVKHGKNFISSEVVMERLGVKEKTLLTLSESGEFEMGRVWGKVIIELNSLLRYLDRCHLTKKKKPNDLTATDNGGKPKPELTYVEKLHSDIPVLKSAEEFADRVPIDYRAFIRHCDRGTFTHYRIGSAYKMSEEDWEESMDRIYRLNKTVPIEPLQRGRPSEVEDKVMRSMPYRERKKTKLDHNT